MIPNIYVFWEYNIASCDGLVCGYSAKENKMRGEITKVENFAAFS